MPGGGRREEADLGAGGSAALLGSWLCPSLCCTASARCRRSGPRPQALPSPAFPASRARLPQPGSEQPVRPSVLAADSAQAGFPGAPHRPAAGSTRCPLRPVPPRFSGIRRGGRNGRRRRPGLPLVGLRPLTALSAAAEPGLCRLFLTRPDVKIAEPSEAVTQAPRPCGSRACCAGRCGPGGRQAGPRGARGQEHCPLLPASSLPPVGPGPPPRGLQNHLSLRPGEKVLKEPIPSQLVKSDRGN